MPVTALRESPERAASSTWVSRRRRAPEVEPRPRLELPVDGLGWTREAAHAARVARPAVIAGALDEVDAADLGVGLPVALEVEDELEDVAGGSPDERRPLAHDHRATRSWRARRTRRSRCRPGSRPPRR